MKLIKTIIFDLGGVLVDIDHHKFLVTISNELKLSDEEMGRQLRDGVHAHYMKGNISSEQFYDRVCKKYEHSMSMDQFKGLWNTILIGQKDDVAEIVHAVHADYEIALLSNVDPWHFEYCLINYPIVGVFKKRFLSYEMHLSKPDPQIYQRVIAELQIDPGFCLFIDDLEENIEAAVEAGFRAIQFKNAEDLGRELGLFGIYI